MKHLIAYLLLLTLVCSQICPLENCDECDFAQDPPVACLTCHGWYEASGVTSLCVLSARLIILCVVVGLLFIMGMVCLAVKLTDLNSTKNSRPSNIQKYESPVDVSDSQLTRLKWNNEKENLNDQSECLQCNAKGGTVRLNCGHVFHGDCICWALKGKNSCPVCSNPNSEAGRIYCLKCLRSYMECNVLWYPEIKKRKSRICEQCMKKE